MHGPIIPRELCQRAAESLPCVRGRSEPRYVYNISNNLKWISVCVCVCAREKRFCRRIVDGAGLPIIHLHNCQYDESRQLILIRVVF